MVRAVYFALIVTVLGGCQTLQVVGNHRYINATEAINRGNYEEAVKILKILANDTSFHDVASAQVLLSDLYLKGKGVRQNTSKALELLKTASNDRQDKRWAGIASGKLGWIYFNGVEAKDRNNDIAIDKFEAATWFNKAVLLGDDQSIATLKLITEDPRYYVRLNKDEFTAAPGKRQTPGSEKLQELLKDPTKNYNEIKDRAFFGDAKAQLALAILYGTGRVGDKNLVRAYQWTYLSAEQGNREAQYELGSAYYNGKHIPYDKKAARYWIKKAADQGHPKAINDLGTLVLHPEQKHISPDPELAFKLFQKAADLGESNAMTNLGDMYHDGITVPADKSLARKYYEMASKLGHKIAKERLAKLDQTTSGTSIIREKVIVEKEKVIVEKAVDRGPSSEEIFSKLNKSVFMLIVGNIKQAKRGVKPAVDGIGSAVAVTERLALTNCHVVDKSDFVFFAHGKLRGLADVIHRDTKADICILRSREDDLVPVEASRPLSELKVGETVYAIGSPRGLQNSFTQGVLSGIRKSKGQKWIQTSAPFSPGSSGGGLFDKSGRLIGITTWIRVDKGSQALNFASPAFPFVKKAKSLGR